MQTEFEYIYFEDVTPYDGRKTNVYSCRNKKSTEELGQVLVWIVAGICLFHVTRYCFVGWLFD